METQLAFLFFTASESFIYPTLISFPSPSPRYHKLLLRLSGFNWVFRPATQAILCHCILRSVMT